MSLWTSRLLQYAVFFVSGVYIGVFFLPYFRIIRVAPSSHALKWTASVAETAFPAKPPRTPMKEAIDSYMSYGKFAQELNTIRRTNYQKLTLAHTLISERLHYTQKLLNLESAIDVNQRLASLIADNGKAAYPETTRHYDLGEVDADADFAQVRTELTHFVRDWSNVGAAERLALFPPIVYALKIAFNGDGEGKKVLVPGAGLARLALAISDNLGSDVVAAEISEHAILAYHFLLNRTTHTNQWTIQPWATNWQHQASTYHLFEKVTFPDIFPVVRSNVKYLEGDFLTSLGPGEDRTYDAVVTLFFIDTAEDVVSYFEKIHSVLKKGGIWVNEGPLKWGGYAQLQLTAEEVLGLADLCGFDVDMDSRRSLDNMYGHQPGSLLKFTYVTQFWTARKR